MRMALLGRPRAKGRLNRVRLTSAEPPWRRRRECPACPAKGSLRQVVTALLKLADALDVAPISLVVDEGEDVQRLEDSPVVGDIEMGSGERRAAEVVAASVRLGVIGRC